MNKFSKEKKALKKDTALILSLIILKKNPLLVLPKIFVAIL